MSISSKLVRRPSETPMGPAQTRRQAMQVMVFAKATEDSKMDGPPTPEQLEAFAFLLARADACDGKRGYPA
jgi:hypothetical protein